MKSYLNHFFSLHCALDILPFFRTCKRYSAKEVTESFAMWHAATKVLGLRSEDDVVVVVSGDGVKPRTAGLLAHVTRWECHSIDPKMDIAWFATYEHERAERGERVQRLCLHRDKSQNVRIDCNGKIALIIMPHSHATVAESLNTAQNYAARHLIFMPCCNFSKLRETGFGKPQTEYRDENVWSEKNLIKVWKDI